MKETDKSVGIKDNFPYKDILYLEHPTSKNHPRQPRESRAGQFSPFAALTGYEDQVKETGRLTNKKIELDEGEKQILDEKLEIIRNFLGNIEVTVTYFIKDKLKEGGKYEEKTSIVKNVDNYNKKIIFIDKERIPIEDIVNIDIINEHEYQNLI